MQTFKAPLHIYIVWNPAFTEGKQYANFLYSEFCRNDEMPLTRGIGIPVFFRSKLDENGKPLPINFDLAERNAVIVLVDGEMFDHDPWRNYFRDLALKPPGNARIFPVALDKQATAIDPRIRQQYILFDPTPLPDKNEEFKRKCKKIRSELLHDLSRLLMNMAPASEAAKEFSPPPIKLFISHAKKDGKTIAMDFREHIRKETKLGSFFDANDIANGFDFAKELEAGVKNSALVVFQTDEYSTREWCRTEIIIAKKNKSAIVVVNAVNSGEKRSFPYIGNAPTIRWAENFPDIIDLALTQVLYNEHYGQLLEKTIPLYDLSGFKVVKQITTPPELFSYIHFMKMKEKTGDKLLVLYPDPPLGNEEINVLNEIDSDITFVTPVMLPNLIFGRKESVKPDTSPDALLAHINMGVSISDNADLEMLGYSPKHLRDATIEFSRYLLIHGANLIYGGDLRDGGYTYLFAELTKQYSSKENYNDYRFTNYFAWPIYRKLTKEDERDFRVQKMLVEKVPPPEGIDPDMNVDTTTIEGKLIMAKSFSLMRKKINEKCNARILLGGKTEGFQGIYPGICEEAMLAMQENKPVYLLGAFGGATLETINLLTKKSSTLLNKERLLNNKAYLEIYIAWEKAYNEKIDLDKFFNFFNNYTLKRFSQNNGLSEEENLRLFETNNLSEIIFYMLKGLLNIVKTK